MCFTIKMSYRSLLYSKCFNFVCNSESSHSIKVKSVIVSLNILKLLSQKRRYLMIFHEMNRKYKQNQNRRYKQLFWVIFSKQA